MRLAVQSLLRLQELEIVLEESKIIHRLAHPESLKQLEAEVQGMREELPTEYLRRYDRLRKSGLGVAQEKGGTCTACHLTVNIGDLGRMRRGQLDWVCPNCARFLLLEPAADVV